MNPQKNSTPDYSSPKKSYGIGPGAKAQRRANCAGKNVKYLDIIVDEHLTFANQIESVCNKAHGKVATFRHGRRIITVAARRTFYLPIIKSTLDYASSAFFHSLHTNTYNKILTTRRICTRDVYLVYTQVPILTSYCKTIICIPLRIVPI